MTAPASPDAPRIRLTVLLIVVGCLFIALIARLWFLQVIHSSAARKQLATSSSGLITIYTPAPRGRILDRAGRALVANENLPVIEVQQQDATDPALMARLAALTGMTVKKMTAAVASNQYLSYDYVPVVRNATPMEILYIQEHATDFPGVQATTITQPYVTRLGESAGNILGYVGPIGSAQLAAATRSGRYPYRAGDIVGLAGVEAQYESQLRGTPGTRVIQVNSSGVYLSTLTTTSPVAGHDVRLSIDGQLQQVALTALHQGEAAARHTFDTVTKRPFTAPGGSAVALDPRNGQVLALATDPSYDPNQFNNGGISQANYDKLNPCAAVPLKQQQACALANPADPLLDRATQGQYAPGSTFKLVTGTAGLKYGVITPSSTYNDVGVIHLGGAPFCNDNCTPYGPVQLAKAITVSSDNYFNQIGIDLWDGRNRYGPDALQKVADAYGFNQPTGIDLPGESVGTIPTPALIAHDSAVDPAVYGTNTSWHTGDSIHTTIGQGYVLVTPLQLANAYAAFANGGTLYQPHLALDAQTATGRVVEVYRPTVIRRTPALDATQRAAMVAGFTGVVNGANGTASGDFAGTPLATADIAGKTGTAQVTAPGKQDTSVFTSFAPASSPRYVIDAFVEDAGYGASVAAPVVREMYDQLFHKPLQSVTYSQLGGSQT